MIAKKITWKEGHRITFLSVMQGAKFVKHRSGTFEQAILASDIVAKVELTDKEKKSVEFKSIIFNNNTQNQWKRALEKDKDIIFSKEEYEYSTGILKKISKAGDVDPGDTILVDLYRRMVEGALDIEMEEKKEDKKSKK